MNIRSIVACGLLMLGLLIDPACGDLAVKDAKDVKDVNLLTSKTNDGTFRLTIVNGGERPTESFFGARGLVGLRVLRPGGSLETRQITGLFTGFKTIPPGEEIADTIAPGEVVGSAGLNGTYRFYFMYGGGRSNVVSFDVQTKDGKEPGTSRVALDAIACYQQLGANVGHFDQMLSPAGPDKVEVETRTSLIALSMAQMDFLKTVERKFGEPAAQREWIFAWNDDWMGEDFRKGKVVEISEHFDTAKLQPVGWSFDILLQRGPTDRWILDVKTFSRSEHMRKELAASAKALAQITQAMKRDKYESLHEVSEAVNAAFR